MNYRELSAIVKTGESDRVEFKRSVAELDSRLGRPWARRSLAPAEAPSGLRTEGNGREWKGMEVDRRKNGGLRKSRYQPGFVPMKIEHVSSVDSKPSLVEINRSAFRYVF